MSSLLHGGQPITRTQRPRGSANALEGRRPYEPDKEAVPMGPEQWLVIVTCRDEPHQVELLKRFQGEGLPCRALMA
jgi:hypothetical protein